MPEILVLDRETLPVRLQKRALDIAVCPADKLPESWLDQVIGKSLQPHVLAHEGPEDVGTEEQPGRFRNLQAYER